MIRPVVLCVVLPFALALPGLGQSPGGGPAPAGKASPAGKQPPRKELERWRGITRADLESLLNQMIDVKDLQQSMTLKEALGHLYRWMANEIPEPPIFFDEAAFRAEDFAVVEAPDVLETPIRFPPFARKMSIANALRFVLGQVPGHNATFLLRAGMLEITTRKAASPKQLLRQGVIARYENVPLDAALDDLSERTGLSVLVDGRVGDKIKTPVTANLGNDVALEGVLRLLTDMAGLKLVVTDDAVYVTTPANARVLREEAAGAGAA